MTTDWVTTFAAWALSLSVLLLPVAVIGGLLILGLRGRSDARKTPPPLPVFMSRDVIVNRWWLQTTATVCCFPERAKVYVEVHNRTERPFAVRIDFSFGDEGSGPVVEFPLVPPGATATGSSSEFYCAAQRRGHQLQVWRIGCGGRGDRSLLMLPTVFERSRVAIHRAVAARR